MPEHEAGRGALDGLRVVDLTSTFMGPYCTMLLAQWGADVIKVEPPAGDPVRYIGDVRGTGMGPVFLAANRGKRSIVLDLAEPGASATLAALIDWCDVFVQSLRPGAARRAGVDPVSVLARNPSCVAVAFRGFGVYGPSADEPAYDDIIQARSGLAAVQGGSDDPGYVRSAVADKTVGVFGAAALLAALHQREATGRGVGLDIPMFETMVGFNLLEQQGGRVFDPPRGPSGYARTASPHRRPFATRDGALSVLCYTDRHWRSLFELIGRPELADDPRYRTIRERTQHIDELYRMVADVLPERTNAEWQAVFAALDIPVAAVNSVEDLFTDPQLCETGFFRSVAHPTEGPLVLPAITGPTGDDPSRSWAPRLGADTERILRELGIRQHPPEHSTGGPSEVVGRA